MRVAAILLVMTLAACNVRFDADFEADTVGNPPPASPPGPPSDEIVLSNSATRGEGIIVRITENPELVPAGRPHRFMSLIRDPDPGLTTATFLRTSPLATSTQSIFLSWEQVVDGGGEGEVAFSRFPIGSVDDLTMCWILTRNDDLYADCFIDGESVDSDLSYLICNCDNIIAC